MQIKEIYVEAKRSKNFQTFTVGTLVTLDKTNISDEKYTEIVKTLQAKVNNLAQAQFKQ